MIKAIFGLLGLWVLGWALYAINPWYCFVYALFGVGTIAVTLISNRKAKRLANERLWAGLTAQAYRLEALASSGFANEAGFALEEGEKFIAEVPNIELAEYRSGGSTYRGGNAGFSVPVFGGVRANFGGSQGQLVRNPAQLTVIDRGTVSYTSKRVIFTGAQQTRIFELEKVLHFEVGTNGLWVTISSSNKEATSTLQTSDNGVLGPGSMFDLAKDANDEGEAAGIAKAKALAELMRKTVAEAQQPKR